MRDGLAPALVIAGVVLLVLMVFRLTKRLRLERARQPHEGRSPLWFLIMSSVLAYLMAYFAFERDLQAPIRLAFVGMAVAAIPVVRRLIR